MPPARGASTGSRGHSRDRQAPSSGPGPPGGSGRRPTVPLCLRGPPPGPPPGLRSAQVTCLGCSSPAALRAGTPRATLKMTGLLRGSQAAASASRELGTRLCTHAALQTLPLEGPAGTRLRLRAHRGRLGGCPKGSPLCPRAAAGPRPSPWSTPQDTCHPRRDRPASARRQGSQTSPAEGPGSAQAVPLPPSPPRSQGHSH